MRVRYPAAFYAALHCGTPGDLRVYAAAVEGADSVLELGCGYGRMLDVFASPRRDVVGLDVDAELLAMAASRLRSVPGHDRVALVEQDMRAFELGRTFDIVALPYNGLYCATSESCQQRVLERAAAHLAPGGRFVFDAYDADGFHNTPPGADDDAWFALRTVEVEGRAYGVLERSRWDRKRQRLTAEYRYVPIDGGVEVTAEIPQRYVLTSELRGMLARAGLALDRIERPFDGGPEDGGPEDGGPEDGGDGDDGSWLAVATKVGSRDGRARS